MKVSFPLTDNPEVEFETTFKHLFSINDLSKDCILDITREIPTGEQEPCISEPQLSGTATLLFQEPSMRTITSFSVAVTGLGLIPVLLYAQPHECREQANITDEIKQLALTGTKCIICRTVKRLDPYAYKNISVPIINAGDGGNEHPTQALIDITVMRHFGLEGRTIAILGNGKDHRTIHSLCLGLRHFDVRIIILGPKDILPKTPYLHEHTELHPIKSRMERDEAFAEADFIYLTPFKYFDKPHYEDTFELLGLTKEEANRILKPTAKILHPFPRFNELDASLDGSSYDAYQLQVKSGALIRDRVLRFALALGCGNSSPSQTGQRREDFVEHQLELVSL